MKFFLPFLFLFLCLPTHATIIIESVSGYSNLQGLNINNNANLIILGGFAGNPEACTDTSKGCSLCSSLANTSSTCNNCFPEAAPATFPPCNTKRAHDGMVLRITFRSTSIGDGGGYAKITRPNAATDGTPETVVATGSVLVLKEQSATITVRWDELCRNFLPTDGNPAYNSCEDIVDSHTQIFKVGLSSDQFLNNTSTSDSLQFTITARDIKTGDDNATISQSNCSSRAGLCNFSFFPGDQKAFIENVSMGSSQVKINSVHFLCAREDQGGFADIYNWPATGSVGVVNNALSSDFLDGLENGKVFSCITASEDDTGNIGYFMTGDIVGTPGEGCPDNSIMSGFTSCRQVRPDAVGGLFKDNCFIATAAYGSSWEPHVQTLRSFRNTYLNTHKMGRLLVSLYYKLSPPLAQWIATSEERKLVARWALTPVVYTVSSFMKAPLLTTLGLLFLMGAGLFGFMRLKRTSFSKGHS